MKALLTHGEDPTRGCKWFALALLAVACGCQFSISGSSPATADEPPPSVTPRDGFDVVDLASRPDLGSVMPDLSTVPGHVGDACTGACGSGLTCMTWVPAGYCSRMCNGPADCPSGSSCVDIGGQGQFCLGDDHGGCARADLRCIDCSANVCGPPSLCDAC